MKKSYVVEFSISNTVNDWSRKEFTSKTKALAFISLMMKFGHHCQIFPSTLAWKNNAPYNPEFLGAQPARAGQDY
jgi:hypothetical protein